MDIQIVKTGRIVYKVDGTLAVLLCEAFPEHFTRYEKPVPPPVEPTWAVRKLLSGGFVLQFVDGAMTLWYEDYPEQAAAYFKRIGKAVPPNILEQYRAAVGDGPSNARRTV